MAFRLLACDFDRTLTDHPYGLNPKVPDALARLQAAGVKVAVCSGQPLQRLRAALPQVDAYAAENGCVVWTKGTDHPWVHPWPQRADVIALLQARGVAHRPFDVIFDIDRVREAELRLLLRPEHNALSLPNVDAINLMPADVDKGTGLGRIQAVFGIRREETVAVGDGENDVALLRAAGLGVAVANAMPQVVEAAQRKLELPDGEGVCALVEELIAGHLAPSP